MLVSLITFGNSADLTNFHCSTRSSFLDKAKSAAYLNTCFNRSVLLASLWRHLSRPWKFQWWSQSLTYLILRIFWPWQLQAQMIQALYWIWKFNALSAWHAKDIFKVLQIVRAQRLFSLWRVDLLLDGMTLSNAPPALNSDSILSTLNNAVSGEKNNLIFQWSNLLLLCLNFLSLAWAYSTYTFHPYEYLDSFF